jgi:hypothetical protein
MRNTPPRPTSTAVESGQRALAEDAIGLRHHLPQREVHATQPAEQRVELRHEHGSGHAFAGDVAEDEEQVAV